MKIELTALGMVILVLSFIGFLVENIWLAFTKGFMDNRNMTLPFLLGYGLLVVGMYFFLGTPEDVRLLGHRLNGNNVMIYYLLSAVIVSIGEIALGTLVEHFLGFEYWNYEWIPLHITKYTSVPTSLGFAAIITLFMEHVFPVVMEFARTSYSEYLSGICGVLLIMCTIDMISSYVKMYRGGGKNVLWRVDLKEKHIAGVILK